MLDPEVLMAFGLLFVAAAVAAGVYFEKL